MENFKSQVSNQFVFQFSFMNMRFTGFQSPVAEYNFKGTWK